MGAQVSWTDRMNNAQNQKKESDNNGKGKEEVHVFFENRAQLNQAHYSWTEPDNGQQSSAVLEVT